LWNEQSPSFEFQPEDPLITVVVMVGHPHLLDQFSGYGTNVQTLDTLVWIMIGNVNIDTTQTFTKPLPVECAVIANLPVEH
jgi:hypothetical protein